MFKDEQEVLNRLESEENILNIINGDNTTPENIPVDPTSFLDDVINEPKKVGRPRGAKERDYEERADIAVLADVLGNTSVSKMLGISTATAHIHNEGKINHKDKKKDTTLESIITSRKNSIRNLATKKLKEVLMVVDEQSIENLRGNAIKATTVATNLSRIVEKLEPKERVTGPTANFIIMQPPTAKEEDYEVIDV